MPKFSIRTPAMATTTTKKGGIGFITITKARAEIIEVLGNGSGTTAPADVQHSNLLEFSTGTVQMAGAAATPAKFDQNSAVSIFTSSEIDLVATTEPETLQTPGPVTLGYNQRGGLRWAVPRGEGVILTFDTPTNEDMALSTDSNAAGNVDLEIHWWEA